MSIAATSLKTKRSGVSVTKTRNAENRNATEKGRSMAAPLALRWSIHSRDAVLALEKLFFWLYSVGAYRWEPVPQSRETDVEPL